MEAHSLLFPQLFLPAVYPLIFIAYIQSLLVRKFSTKLCTKDLAQKYTFSQETELLA